MFSNIHSKLILFITINASRILLSVCCFSNSSILNADDESATVLNRSPILSARANAMGGALSTLADGSDAPYYNPAGIGGIIPKTSKKTNIRQFYFVYGGATYNKNAQKLRSEFADKGAIGDSSMGESILDAHAGERQYAGINLFPNFSYGRTIIGPIYDSQLAAVPKGENSGDVDLLYQTRSGYGVGASVTDPGGRLYLGAFFTQLDVKSIEGTFDYSEIAVKKTRSEALADGNTQKYSGSATHLGMLWCFSQKYRPTLALVGRDFGKTKYRNSTDDDEDDIELNTDFTAGFSVSPKFGNSNFFNFIVEGANLNDPDMAFSKKWKTGMEVNFGAIGMDSYAGLRAGVNGAGGSFGGHLNLGLIGIQYANYAEDIGLENSRVIERRQNILVGINLVE